MFLTHPWCFTNVKDSFPLVSWMHSYRRLFLSAPCLKMSAGIFPAKIKYLPKFKGPIVEQSATN